jgi:hypothetical protein
LRAGIGESYAGAMDGPYPAGTYTGLHPRREFGPLKGGARYRVVRAFTDYDGGLHEPGEAWTFLGENFLPHHDGLSLFVSLDGSREWHIRMCWRPEDQGPVIDALEEYLALDG